MRKTLSALLIAITPALAQAQPVERPACDVTISRASEEVRAAIEAWVRKEPRCATSLDVRVVPTDGGFYLFARDGSGRIRERVVPDAQSAAVLVASWVADDSVAPAAPPPPAPEAAPPEPAPAPLAPEPRGDLGAIAPPAVTPTIVASAPARVHRRHWLTVGAMTETNDGDAHGLRADVELVSRGKWAFGVGVSWARDIIQKEESVLDELHPVHARDVRVVATAHRAFTRGPWSLQLGAGLGLTRTHISSVVVDYTDGAHTLVNDGLFPTAEISATLALELRGGWAVTGGPVALGYLQQFKSLPLMDTVANRDVELMLFGGVRRRL